MAEKIRVVHYINQFYAGMGGEDNASIGVYVREEPVGPGLKLSKELGDDYQIVATIICGDNHIAENIETVTHIIIGLPGENLTDYIKTVRCACENTDGEKLQLQHVLR